MIRVDSDGPIAVVTIDRPEVRNALDIPTMLALGEAFDAAEANEDVRVILVTGAGEQAFVAGADIADIESRRGLAHYEEFAETIHRVFRRIELCPKPTIGAIHGYALGGGVELLLSLDLRFVSDTARIGVPEIKIGLFPGAGGSQRLIRQIPLCRAKELMFTGDMISGDEAVALGLANRVIPGDRLLEEVKAIALQLAEKSPLVLKLLKRTLADGAEMPLGSALAHEQAMISLVFDAEDAHEGCRAFLDKRPPQFVGA